MSTKAFPADWEQPITARGVTRNPAQKCYNVRISVAGKQMHVACSASQGFAAYLYDLALWKLCPKMAKKPEPNGADDFRFASQHRVDQFCPRLNKLYERAPFLRVGDGMVTEEALREFALNGRNVVASSDEMEDYDKAVEFLRRAVVEVSDIEVKLANRMSRLTRLHKLAEAPLLRNKLKDALDTAQNEFGWLRESLERQRAYYQKLTES